MLSKFQSFHLSVYRWLQLLSSNVSTAVCIACIHTYIHATTAAFRPGNAMPCLQCTSPNRLQSAPEYHLGPEKLSKVRGTRTKAGTSSASGLPFPDPAPERHRSPYFRAINLLQRPCVRPGMAGASPILLEPTILTAPPRLGDERKLGLAAVSSHEAPAANHCPPPACSTPEPASPLTKRFTQSLDARRDGAVACGSRVLEIIQFTRANLLSSVHPAAARLTPLSTRSCIKLAADPENLPGSSS
jgi:hypothetical protein